MAPKPKGGGKKKKPLTEEEKKAKAELMALQAEELRKKKIRDRRIAIKQAMIEEEKRSKMSMLNVHKEWRRIMRVAKIEDLRKDIEWLSEKHVHQVELKDKNISICRDTLREAEAQHRSAQIKHLSMLDGLLDLHHLQTSKMEKDFQEHLKRLEEEFMAEKNLIIKTHAEQKKEMKDMIAAMKIEFEEAIDEKRQDFEATREELKLGAQNKNTEEYNMLRISLESGIEDLERRIEHTHQTYMASTEAKSASFKALVAKDAITARVIEQRMRKLIWLHEILASWRVRISTHGKEWELQNKTIRDEKDRLNNYYMQLKHKLDKLHYSERAAMKETSKHVFAAREDLLAKLKLAERVQLLGRMCSQLETEHERVFPFDPLHCSSIPTVPGARLDQEIKAEDGSAGPQEGLEKSMGEVKIELERHPHMVVPRDQTPIASGIPLPTPSNFPTEPGGQEYRWSSYGVDDLGNEVEEVDYMSQFNKRFNKAMLDKLAVETERDKLMEENAKLSTQLRNYLDGLTIAEHLKTAYNVLLNVDKKPRSPRQTPMPPYVIHAAKKKVVRPPVS